jgi:(S)-ureidoglycine-glyoxylate aminotransferase
MKVYRDLSLPQRTIMTPGPVEVDPRVLRVMSTPVIGQFDPAFTHVMNETMELIRALFQTNNEYAFPVDGTSRAGIEAVLTSLIEPGDVVLVPIFGRFGHLLVEISERCGAHVEIMERPWGTVFAQDDIIAKIREVRPALVAMVHGETSTGRVQDVDRIGAACREVDALFAIDVVATIAGMDFRTDDWLIDAAIGGTQKCISVPSGMAPLTFNSRAADKMKRRKRVERGLREHRSGLSEQQREHAVIQSNYLDLAQLMDYWSPVRLNHHTEMTTMLYALREGLRIIMEEGLVARFARHKLHEQALVHGLLAMGVKLFGDPSCKLPMVTCIEVPDGIHCDAVTTMMLEHFSIEIVSSFGPLKGKIWRVGTMGYSCNQKNVLHLLGALEAVFMRNGMQINVGRGVQAALDVYEQR